MAAAPLVLQIPTTLAGRLELVLPRQDWRWQHRASVPQPAIYRYFCCRIPSSTCSVASRLLRGPVLHLLVQTRAGAVAYLKATESALSKACTVQLLLLLWLVIEDHDNLFIMAEVVHFLGIGVLIYKLWTKKNAGGVCSLKVHCNAARLASPVADEVCMSLLSCLGLAACRDLRVRDRTGVVTECCMCAGLSLRSQELTALFLGVRLFCRCRLCAMPLSCYRLISGGR